MRGDRAAFAIIYLRGRSSFRSFNSAMRTILLSGGTAGTLDILCAIVFLAGGNAGGVFRFIAAGAIGNAAYEGGAGMVLLGVLFHYVIAFSFAGGYFLVFPHFTFLRKHEIISGLLYGIFVWAFMQYAVLPFTHNPPEPFTFSGAWKNIVILMFAVGLPVSLITQAHFASRPPGRRGGLSKAR